MTAQGADQPQPLPLSVDRTSPVPLYFQLAQQLEAAVEQGRLAPGTLLGNEIDLAHRLGLSRPTVRQAIQSLVDKGLMVRRRGVGTQVVHSQVRRPLELSSLYDDLEAAGQRPATKVLRATTEPATAEIAAALGLPEGTEVHLVERLRYAHDEPMALLRNHLPRTCSTSGPRSWSPPASTGSCGPRASPCTAPASRSAPVPRRRGRPGPWRRSRGRRC